MPSYSRCPECGDPWPEALRGPLRGTWKRVGITCPTCRAEKLRRIEAANARAMGAIVPIVRDERITAAEAMRDLYE